MNKHLIVMNVLNQVAEASEGNAVDTNTNPVTLENLKAALTDSEGNLSEGGQAILDAFTAGDLIATNAEVSRNIEGKGKVSKDYIRLQATNLNGALAMIGGTESDVWEKFNVGYDMGIRSTLGQQIVRESEGPEKYLGQAAKYFSKMFNIPVELATEQLKSMLASGALSADALQAQANQAE